MQRGLTAGGNDEWFNQEWCINVVKKYVNELKHTTSDEELLHKFIAHAYTEFRIDFLQYMPNLFEPDYDFWSKVHDQLSDEPKMKGFFCHLISEYSNSDYEQPTDIRWYESLAEECDVDDADQETIFELFNTAYLNNSSRWYRHKIVGFTKTWLGDIDKSCVDFYMDSEEFWQYAYDHPEDAQCRFIREVEDFDWRIELYQSNGIITNDDYIGSPDVPEAVANEVKLFREKIPVVINSAAVLSDLYIDGNNVTFEIILDEAFFSIDNIKRNAVVYKEGSLSDIVANMNESCRIFQEAGMGILIVYQSGATMQTTEIAFSNDELAHAMQHPNDDQQRLESQIRSLKATCPRNLGGELELTDFDLEDDYVTRTIKVDEAVIELADLAANSEQLKKLLSDSIRNEDNLSLIALVFKCEKGLRDNYVGKDSGQVVTIELSPNEIKDIISQEARNEKTRYWKKRVIRGCVSWAVLIALIVALVKLIKFLAS